LRFCKLPRFFLFGERLTLNPYIASHANGLLVFISYCNITHCGRFTSFYMTFVRLYKD
jgi:hypothetical protein